MLSVDIIFLGVITFGLCLAYFFLEHLFSLFFEKHVAHLGRRSISSVAMIIIVSVLGYYVSSIIPDVELGNRVLHAFGGGFMTMLVCFLVVKDTRINITKFQFFVFSVLVVTAFGVGNEIFEFLLQNYTSLVFANSTADTWLDLISNTIGIIVGGACFTPFITDKIPS